MQVPLTLLGFWFEAVLESAIVELFGGFNDEWFLGQSNLPLFDPPIDPAMLFETFRSVLYLAVILLIATWLTSMVMTGALIHGVSGQILEDPISVAGAYSFALGRFGAMLGASILVFVCVVLMVITIIGIPFAIFFGVRWAFFMQTASLERCGPTAAMARSSALVRDNWWRVFGILLLIGILLAIANGIAGGIAQVDCSKTANEQAQRGPVLKPPLWPGSTSIPNRSLPPLAASYGSDRLNRHMKTTEGNPTCVSPFLI